MVGRGKCCEGVSRSVVMTRALQGGGIGGNSRLYEGGRRKGGREEEGREGGKKVEGGSEGWRKVEGVSEGGRKVE